MRLAPSFMPKILEMTQPQNIAVREHGCGLFRETVQERIVLFDIGLVGLPVPHHVRADHEAIGIFLNERRPLIERFLALCNVVLKHKPRNVKVQILVVFEHALGNLAQIGEFHAARYAHVRPDDVGLAVVFQASQHFGQIKRLLAVGRRNVVVNENRHVLFDEAVRSSWRLMISPMPLIMSGNSSKSRRR